MSVVLNRVLRDWYLDSVSLMRASAVLCERAGVEDAALMIGTPSNHAILDNAGLLSDVGREARPSDVIVAVRAESGAAAGAAAEAAEAILEGDVAGSGGATHGRAPTLRAADEALGGANLALISVPGEFAVREARRAVAAGLDVLIFSDNVPVADEVALKREASAAGRIVMGPDCGTAWLGGVPIAFANEVAAGPVGLVSASGTGMQEVATLLDRAGSGISHGIGVGGRDTGDEVGGIATLQALAALRHDEQTAQVVLLSKPPGPATRQRVFEALAGLGKPAIACFLGADAVADAGDVRIAATLEEAAALALGIDVETAFGPRGAASARLSADGAADTAIGSRGRLIRGLFTGGTLCAEAQIVLAARALAMRSNAPVPGLSATVESGGEDHLLLDLGADEYTRGRPHPMIEPAVRRAPFEAALADPMVGVVIVDVVLGHGAHPSPADDLVDVLGAAPRERPAVVASVTGTDRDPQSRARQVRALTEAGIHVARSNAAAADLAADLIGADRNSR